MTAIIFCILNYKIQNLKKKKKTPACDVRVAVLSSSANAGNYKLQNGVLFQS